MTDSSHTPTADGLFQKWKQFLDGGAQTTASLLAADHPHLVPALQRLIDDHLATHPSGPGSTLTGAGGPRAASKPPDIPGYVVESFLGGGGMGEVWLVKDQLDRKHALKLVRSDRLTTAGRDRFLAEARAMDRVRHPHVVHIHHYAIHGDLPYYLMRPYPASLKDRLRDYQADPKAAVRLMAAVADGVGHLHARGFVHRDLKPGNVLLDEAGQPAVSDFGLVKSLTGDPTSDPGSVAGGCSETYPTGTRGSNTVLGSVLGTRAYMSPEQAAGRTNEANPRWDVWALGVMLHELLTGELPASSSAPERLLEPSESDNPPPSSWKPGLDPRLERIVQKCLSRDPAERYGDGAALAAALQACIETQARRRWGRRLAVADGLVAIGLVVLLAVGLWRSGPTAEPDARGDGGEFRDEIVASLQARLRKGETVELIPATGMPVWYNLAVGKGLVRPYSADDDKAMVIDSGRMILMDMPPTGLDRFRFQVRARQASSELGLRFGIYAGRLRLTVGQRDVECFLTLWFNDRTAKPGQPPRGTWTLAARPHVRVPGVGGVTGGVEFDSGDYEPPVAGTYHTVVVEVRPEYVKFTLDDQPCGEIALPLAPAMAQHLAVAAGLPAETNIAFVPGGGYGLLVFGGTCAFRQATVQGLPEP